MGIKNDHFEVEGGFDQADFSRGIVLDAQLVKHEANQYGN